MTIRSKFNTHIAKTSPFPLGLEVSASKGTLLYNPQGKSYLDFISGIGVSNLGHGHPQILQAIHHQVDLYLHTMVYGEHIQSPQVMLAELLTSKLPANLNQVYFLSSGAEAIETALKLARKSTGRQKIMACHHAYHGSTYGAMSLMSDHSKTDPYNPLVPGISHISFNNFEDLEKIDATYAAVVLEIIQAEAGIILPDQHWLQAMQRTCNEHGVMIISDEIQSAMGRTGSLFAMDQYGFSPDILVLGKSLGGGMPLSACVADQNILNALADDPPLTHMSTFGGHPVSCAAGLAAVTILTTTDIIEQSKIKSRRLLTNLVHPAIQEIRHSGGLWMAIDLGDPTLVQKLIPVAQEKGLLVDWFLFNDQSIRIAPPLTISDHELDFASEIIIDSLDLISVNHSIAIP